MELIRGQHNLKPHHRACVATIGNFDGVHRGHAQVIERVKSQAKLLGLPAVVISFEPLPREFFAKSTTPPRLTRLRERLPVLALMGVDRVLILRFSQTLAEQDPHEFIQEVLVEGLGIKYLVVGDDFKFGKNRKGDFAMLKNAGEQYGFEVVDTDTVTDQNWRISSTRIREALEAGQMGRASELLGRPYRMTGRVAKGDQRGRTMGYPTANIHIHRKASPLNGVFAVVVHGLPEGPVEGVANLGVRPTFKGDNKAVLEVHLFDFARDIYDHYVHVEFVHKIRAEQKFESAEALIEQIHQDTAEAKAWFERAKMA